jgi:GNAT superfamily N-acetyltransferase
MLNTEIKPVTAADNDAILEVYRQCEDFLALGPIAKASMDMVLQDRQEADAEDGIFCGIFSGEKMIGVVSYVPSRFEFRPVDTFILLLMLTPPYRGQGIGGDIVNRIEKEMGAKGRIRSIKSWVQVNNPDALRFWEKHGYKIVSGPESRPDKTTVFQIRKDINRMGAK